MDNLSPWYNEELGETYMKNRSKAMSILQSESELQEIVKLVGQDALSPDDRLTMETAKMIREDFLQQNAFVTEDAYSSYRKQFRLLSLILKYDEEVRAVLNRIEDLEALFTMPSREKIGRAKMIAPEAFEKAYDDIESEMKSEILNAAAGGKR